MRAVILAAGRGTRLGALGAETPKGLLDVGGRSLLDRSLDALATRDYDDVTIVTGHLEDQLKKHLATRSLSFVTNERYAETGSAASLQTAFSVTGAPFLLLESDIVYDPTVLDAIDTADATIVTVDPSGSGDEVFVYRDESDGLVALGKGVSEASGATPSGELAGITWVSAELAQEFERHMQRGEFDHYETVFARCAATVPIKVKHVAGKGWREIDTPADLAAAQELVAGF